LTVGTQPLNVVWILQPAS